MKRSTAVERLTRLIIELKSEEIRTSPGILADVLLSEMEELGMVPPKKRESILLRDSYTWDDEDDNKQ